MHTERNRHLKTIELVAQTFMAASKAMGEQKDTVGKFASVEQLKGLHEQVFQLSPDGGIYWAEILTDQAASAAKAMDALDKRDLCDDETTFVTGLALADALEGMSRSLLNAAGTFRTCALPGDSRKEGEALKSAARELAFKYYRAGIGVQDAIGSLSELNPLAFPPGPWAVGAQSPAVECEVCGPTSAPPEAQPPTEYNAKYLKEQLIALAGLAGFLAAFFERFALLLLALLDGGMFWTCARLCGTPSAAHGAVLAGPTIAAVRATLVATRTYQPEMDVTWSVCCWDWCWFTDKDHLAVTVSATVTLGAPWILPPGRPVGAAMTVANQRAAAFPLGTLAVPAPSC